MSTTTPTTPAATGVTGTGISRGRAAVVAALLAAGSVTIAVLVLWQPWGARNDLSYATLAAHRDAGWAGYPVTGLAVTVVAVTLGIAVCALVTAGRGTALATVGAVLSGIGGALSGAAATSFGMLSWYATAVDALPAEAGTALLRSVERDSGHALGLNVAGFLLLTAGSLVLMAALARAVPRLLPVVYLVLTVALFALGGVEVVQNIAEAAQMLITAAIGGYLLRAARAS